MKRVFLGLGSNLGDRKANLATALRLLKSLGVQVDRVSPIYETEPVGVREQGLFLNAVAETHTTLDPRGLLTLLLGIERTMKRERTVKNGPRVIDLDILFYQSLILRMPDLEVPHPRFRERLFVLAPLSDLAPNWRDPVTRRTVAELLDRSLASGAPGAIRRLAG